MPSAGTAEPTGRSRRRGTSCLTPPTKHTDGEYYQGASESIINARPSDNTIGSASTWGHSDIDYDKRQFEKAAALFEQGV